MFDFLPRDILSANNKCLGNYCNFIYFINFQKYLNMKDDPDVNIRFVGTIEAN